MKIYCDTSTLPHNISRHSDEKSQRELAALNQLAETYQMFGPHLVRYEAEKTSNKIRRDHLIVEFGALQPVPNDEKLLNFNIQSDQYGGFISHPLISDVQDEPLCAELIQQGIKEIDAKHITQAVSNDCDVFLTRDERSIINRHRQWLANRLPNLKVLLPSELLQLLTNPPRP